MSGDIPHIVTDSTADIPTELARCLDIAVVPCQIHFGDQTYRDGVDITRQELYRRQRNAEHYTTSQPPVGVFAETYRRLLADGRPILSIHLASQLSTVYNAARLAAQEVDAERITVIDSRQVSMCIGWLAIRAAEMARNGRWVQEILREIRQRIPRLRLYAVIDDLHYLRRSGRVSWVSSLLGNLFAIKPIVLVEQGEVRLVEKVRSLARGRERLAALVASLGPAERIAVMHADAPEAAEKLAEEMARWFPHEKLLIGEAGVTVGAHAGPGAVGVAILLAG